MQSGQSLIDKAAKVCGSRYAVAKSLHVNEGNLGSMAKGAKPIPAGLAARLAHLAGEDPKETALEAIAAKEKDPVLRDELRVLFGLKRNS